MDALEKLCNLDFANSTPDDVRELLSDIKMSMAIVPIMIYITAIWGTVLRKKD